jgi:hypothetical protein
MTEPALPVVRSATTSINFDDAAWFHTTGITPALSDKCAALAGRIKDCTKKKAYHQY